MKEYEKHIKKNKKWSSEKIRKVNCELVGVENPESKSFSKDIKTVAKNPESKSFSKDIKTVVENLESKGFSKDIKTVAENPERKSFSKDIQTVTEKPESKGLSKDILKWLGNPRLRVPQMIKLIELKEIRRISENKLYS